MQIIDKNMHFSVSLSGRYIMSFISCLYRELCELLDFVTKIYDTNKVHKVQTSYL